MRSQWPPEGPFDVLARHFPPQLLCRCSTHVIFVGGEALCVRTAQPAHEKRSVCALSDFTLTSAHAASCEVIEAFPMPMPTNDAVQMGLAADPMADGAPVAESAVSSASGLTSRIAWRLRAYETLEVWELQAPRAAKATSLSFFFAESPFSQASLLLGISLLSCRQAVTPTYSYYTTRARILASADADHWAPQVADTR